MTQSEDFLDEIAREEKRIAELQAELRQRNDRLASLRQELVERSVDPITPEGSSVPVSPIPTPFSNPKKIALFRSLFRGREDVFARRWENSRTGRSGYAPACSNEWKSGICEKLNGNRERKTSRMVCGTCGHQSFLPITDDEIAGHLKGLQVIGVYPLLVDETSWFLAVDFDKTSWQDDIAAFRETCKNHEVPVSIERSRSGNGGHAWFFFTAPVPAKIARAMACFLITETMSHRHQLSMESYDRLFPNQDTLPRGGFGNLIALPLQRRARENGNAVLVDNAFAPFHDQWSFLAGVRRIDSKYVYAIANEATRNGNVVGFQALDSMGNEQEEEIHPWGVRPTNGQQHIDIKEPLPPVVHAVMSQRLYIEKRGLPSSLMNELKRLASFSNPEFYKRQNMRLSTGLTPRIISCSEEHAEHIALPRGCLPDAQALLKAHNVEIAMDDKRSEGMPLDLSFQGNLTPLQSEAAEALLSSDMGLLVAPPGIGKTVIAIYAIAARKRSTLVLVHRKPLLGQWVAQLALFLGIGPKDIGRIGGGKTESTGRVDVAMLQSLVRRGVVKDLVNGYGYVVVDECHHSPSVAFEKVLSKMNPRFVSGFTATLQRRDGLHPITRMQLGPVRFTVGPKSKGAKQPFRHTLIVRKTTYVSRVQSDNTSIQSLYTDLTSDLAQRPYF